MQTATVDEEDSASDGDIPFTKKKGKGVAEQLNDELKDSSDTAGEEQEADNDEDLDAEEYVVEKIVAHAFEDDGTLKYEVQWVGYEETTWEPEENLDGCPDELKTYFKKIGGKPAQNLKGRGPGTGVKSGKRKVSENPNESPTTTTYGGGGKKRRKSGGEVVYKDSQIGDQHWRPPHHKKSWEDDVDGVDTVYKDENDLLMVYTVWKNGRHTTHAAHTINQKCPQKIIAFYEAHLQFNLVPQKTNSDEDTERNNVVNETKDVAAGATDINNKVE